jgi:DNA-binding protein HU-beta
MNEQQRLGQKLATVIDITKADARKAVDTVTPQSRNPRRTARKFRSTALASSRSKTRRRGKGRNPSTGATIQIAASKKLTFAPAKDQG